MEFKDRLKKLRNDENISVPLLAEKLGKAESTVRMWEIGKAKPDIDTLLALSDHFHCSVDYLLGKISTKSSDPDIQMICEYTGLTEKAVNILKYCPCFNERLRDVVNLLLENETPAPVRITNEEGHESFPQINEEDFDILYHSWRLSNAQVLSALADYFYATEIELDEAHFDTEEKKKNNMLFLKYTMPNKDLTVHKASEAPIIYRNRNEELVDSVLMLSIQGRLQKIKFNEKIMEVGKRKVNKKGGE